MKLKTINKISILFVVTLFLSVAANNISATVGGPTTIERLSYKPNENSLYYVVRDGGGRGCPPIIEKLNLSTKKRTQVKTCDEIESTYYRDENSAASYNQFIEDTFKYPAVKALPIISLTNNNISILVEYVGEHKFDEYNVSSDFRATILQNNNEKKEVIDFIGCYKDQPNVFKGYIVPDTNKMALEISRIGDCFEGGYTKDDVYILDNINYQDTEPVGYYNYSSEPGVHRGNLVVFAQNSKTVASIPSEIETTGKNTLVSIWWIPALIIGLVVGFIAGHKTRTKSTQEFAAKEQNHL